MTSVSIRDIANAAGVSIKTASGALSGSDSIRMAPATRARILEVAETMGYRPNLAAQAMRSGVMPIVGVLSDGVITSPFASDIMRGLDNGLRRHSLVTMTATLRGGVASNLDNLARFQPRAIVYVSSYHRILSFEAADAARIALLINCQAPGSDLPAIVPDEEQAGREIAALLLKSGRRRIGFVTMPGLVASELRLRGVKDAHDAAGIAMDPAHIFPSVGRAHYNDWAKGKVLDGLTALRASRNLPDAMICGNDRIALELYMAAERLGLRIPDDLAVGSFDNQIEIAQRLHPKLTTMALPFRGIGSTAAEIVSGAAPVPQTITRLPFRLVRRESHRAPSPQQIQQRRNP